MISHMNIHEMHSERTIQKSAWRLMESKYLWFLLTGSTQKKLAVVVKTARVAFQYPTMMVVGNTSILCVSGHIDYLQQITEIWNSRQPVLLVSKYLLKYGAISI
jgi:hypothetical protein